MVMVDGGVPLMKLPVWVIFTFMVIAVVGAGVAVIVNVADVPSVMLVAFAEIVTCGTTGAARVTVMV